jgi:hypothetical protein
MRIIFNLVDAYARKSKGHLTSLVRRVRVAWTRGRESSEEEETVSFVSAAKWRRLIPAGAVAAVLALSYLAPLPSEASNGVGGFGYNCGVKGYGYHDHGKPCPNRPFPGQGIGLAKFGINITTSGDEDNNTTLAGTGHGHSQGHSRGKGQ